MVGQQQQPRMMVLDAARKVGGVKTYTRSTRGPLAASSASAKTRPLPPCCQRSQKYACETHLQRTYIYIYIYTHVFALSRGRALYNIYIVYNTACQPEYFAFGKNICRNSSEPNNRGCGTYTALTSSSSTSCLGREIIICIVEAINHTRYEHLLSFVPPHEFHVS